MIQFCRAGQPELIQQQYPGTKYRASRENPSLNTPEVCLLQVVLQTGNLATFQWVYERLPKAYRTYALDHFKGSIPNAGLADYIQQQHRDSAPTGIINNLYSIDEIQKPELI